MPRFKVKRLELLRPSVEGFASFLASVFWGLGLRVEG